MPHKQLTAAKIVSACTVSHSPLAAPAGGRLLIFATDGEDSHGQTIPQQVAKCGEVRLATDKRYKRLSLACAIVSGICSGAARAAVNWLLTQ
ncbi:hypothetical protein [Streptomyces adustus]